MPAWEDERRAVFAQLSAHRFLTEVLLANMFNDAPSESEREAFIARLLSVAAKTDHLRAANDFEAEEQSDVAVQTAERIGQIVSAALERFQSGH